MCWNVTSGNCVFGEDECWFIHTPAEKTHQFKEYNCNLCEKVFQNQSEYLKHTQKKSFKACKILQQINKWNM